MKQEKGTKKEANPHLTSGGPSFVQQLERVTILTLMAGCLINPNTPSTMTSLITSK